MGKYEGQCGSCEYFEDKRSHKPFDPSFYEQGDCTWYGCRYWPDDSCTTHYRKRGTPASTCYITTIVCNILGYDDHCKELETLRTFRNEVMQKDAKYEKVLYDYDTIGPQIASHLQKDYQKSKDKEFATLLFNFYIQTAARLLAEGKQEDAVSRYQEMTSSLAEYYAISIPLEVAENYDRSNGGHGTLQVKKLGTYPTISPEQK